MKHILNKTYQQQALTYQEAFDTLISFGNGEVSEIEMAAFISAFNMKEISVDELRGFRDALLSLCLKVQLDDAPAIDMCGTGGDGKNTFNVSTISSFIVAGAGYRVIKHGNYGVSSLCGSSNVLEALGYNFTTNADSLNKQLDDSGICFLHAPLFHSAMKHVAPIRRTLGVKTFFNMLGPLVNPVQPSHQLAGVFNLKIGRKYKYLLEEAERKFKVLYNLDGYDEATLTAPLKALEHNGEKEYYPDDFGLSEARPQDLYGGETIDEAAKLFKNILSGQGTKAQTDVVIANSALAISCFDDQKSMTDCIAEARESLDSGKAINTLKTAIAS